MHTLRMLRTDASGEAFADGKRAGAEFCPAGMIRFIPAGAEISAEAREPFDITVIKLDMKVFADAAQDVIDISRVDFRFLAFEQPSVASLIETTRMILSDPSYERWPLIAESLRMALAVAALKAIIPSVIERAGDIGFDAHRRRRVFEFIETNLHRSIHLGELADVSTMSQFHFCGSFRKVMGATPLHYVMRRRVERARRMLLDPKMTIAGVALSCGFSSQSHMTRSSSR